MSTPSRPRTRWPPAAAWTALALFLLSVTLNKLWVVDLGWQLRTGQLILESRAWPTHDLLSYTAADHPWVELRWLFCVVLYLAWQLGGPAMLIVGQAAVIAACWLMIARSARGAFASAWALPVLALGVAAASARYSARPELATYLFFTIDLLLLDAWKRRGSKLVWLLPPVQTLWVNSHTMAIFGPILAWCFVGGDVAGRALERWREGALTRSEPRASGTAGFVSAQLVGVALLTTGAMWVNPYFHDGVMFPFILLRQIQPGHILQRSIAEFISPFKVSIDRWTFDVWCAAALGVVSALSFIPARRRIDPGRIILWTGLAYTFALSVRNAGLFSFAATWIALANLRDAREAHGSANAATPGSSRIVPLVTAAALAWGAWFIGTGRYAARHDQPREAGFGLLERWFPVQATEFLMTARPEPPLFNMLGDGGHLAWAAHERYKVFVDGRLEVYGWAFLTEYLESFARDPVAAADRYGANTILLRLYMNERIVARVFSTPGWALVHLDGYAAVFVRDIPAHAALIAERRIDPRVEWTPRVPLPEEQPTGWRRALGFESPPWASLNLARTWMAIGSIGNAAIFYRKALDADPRHVEARLGLWIIETFQGRAGEAAGRLAGIDIPRTLRANAEVTLARLLVRADRPFEAAEVLERALELNPADNEARDEAARQHFRLGNLPRARELLEQAVARERDERRLPGRLGALGAVLERMGERGRAAETYRRALALDPEEPISKAGLERLGRGAPGAMP